MHLLTTSLPSTTAVFPENARLSVFPPERHHEGLFPVTSSLSSMSSDVNNVVQSSALAANVGLRHVLVCQITVINIPCFCLNWLISRQFQCRCDLSGVLAYTRSVTWPQSGLHWPVQSETSLRKEGAGLIGRESRPGVEPSQWEAVFLRSVTSDPCRACFVPCTRRGEILSRLQGLLRIIITQAVHQQPLRCTAVGFVLNSLTLHDVLSLINDPTHWLLWAVQCTMILCQSRDLTPFSQ